MRPQGESPYLPTTLAGFQSEASKSAEFQRAPGSRLVCQEASTGTTIGSPLEKMTTRCPMTPAGLGLSPPLVASMAKALAPGADAP